MIRVLIGDLFKTKAKTIVNTVNCVGIMGKGIAQEYKKRFPEMYKDYEKKCSLDIVKPGEPYLYEDLFGTSIINFPTKKHWRSPSKLDDVIKGLDIFIAKYKSWGITAIAFPPLGCGNGGLEWSVVGPIMYQKLAPLSIEVEIYAPYGTPSSQLTEVFLTRSAPMDKQQARGRARQKLCAEWVALLEVLHQLESQPYANPVGRTVFQKICYTITEQGVKTGFNFKQGSYGPFSSEVKDALSVFANANLVQETQLGRMTALRTGPEYKNVRDKFANELAPLKSKINKAVDLFCRIKNTEQAEEVTTVFYAVQQRKKNKISSEVSELDVYDYVLKWKKHWDSASKHEAIASAIRNLAMLNWVKVRFSDSLPLSELDF